MGGFRTRPYIPAFPKNNGLINRIFGSPDRLNNNLTT
jgi:hypothetical protein